MIPKFTLVPSEFFSEESARDILSKVVLLENGEPLSFLELPAYSATLIYASDQRPVVYDMAMSLCKIRDYNKIVIDHSDNCVSIVIAEGDNIVFCNAFQAVDFTTAEYFLFMVLKKLQINPEISSVYSMNTLTDAQIISLCTYFKNAEVLQ